MGERIRAYNWAATPLGPIGDWQHSLRTAVCIMLNTPQPMGIGWGPDYIQLYNDAYVSLLDAERHPAMLGQPAVQARGEIWDLIRPDIDAIRAGGWAVSCADRLVRHHRAGEVRDLYFTYSYSSIPDAAAPLGVGGVLCISVETTSAVVLRQREEWQAFLLTLSDALRPLADPTAIQGVASRLLAEQLAADRAYYVECDADAGVCRIHTDYVRHDAPSRIGTYRFDRFAPISALMQAGHAFVAGDIQAATHIPEQIRARYAALAVRAETSVPLLKEGRLVAALTVSTMMPRAWTALDVSLVEATAERAWAAVERARTEAALHASQERLTAAHMATWTWDPVTDQVVMSDTVTDVFGLQPGEPFRGSTQGFSYVHPEGVDRHRALVRQAGARGEGWHAEFRIIRSRDGRVAWLEERATPTRDPHSDHIRISGLVWDITERKRAEEVLREAHATLEQRVAARTAALAAAVEQLRVSEGRLRLLLEQAVVNLLANAHRHTPAGTRIDVTGRVSGGMARLAVRDNGPGIPAGRLETIVEHFGRAGHPTDGTGLGLAIAREIVRLHEGQLWVEPAAGRGVTFHIALPLSAGAAPAAR